MHSITAIVVETAPGSLLVRDVNTGEEIRVITRDANRFSVGNRVLIIYNGNRTMSIPPQITAMSIQMLHPGSPQPPRPPQPPGPPRPPSPPSPSRPTQMRAIVLARRGNSLVVRDVSNNRQVIVNYPYVRHFCAGQRIDIRYDQIILSNPPTVNAVDIIAIC